MPNPLRLAEEETQVTQLISNPHDYPFEVYITFFQAV